MYPVLLYATTGGVALLIAASTGLRSVVSSALAAYIAFVANVGLATWALSPARVVTRGGLFAFEAVLLAGAAAVWWRRGRPRPALGVVRRPAAEVIRDPVSAAFVAFAVLLLAYELVVALTAPANNWDSLTYHLSRAAAWFHHHGIYELADPPTANFNEFPQLAEQQILFGFVATGSGALLALPQYLAELAILLAIYGAARRLGFAAPAAACSACLFATFSFVALEATTAQNDLFAASFPAVAACLILGGTRAELVLGGVAAGIGLAAKPSTVFVAPVLALLVLALGRRAIMPAAAGAASGLVAAGLWPYAFNLAHAGSPLGHGGWTSIGAAAQQPARPGALSNGLDLAYQLLDLSVVSGPWIRGLWVAAILAAGAAGAYWLSRARPRRAVAEAAGVAVPLLAPVLVVAGSAAVAWLAREHGAPVRGQLGNIGPLNRSVAGGAFGPLGAVVLLLVPLLVFVLYALRRVDLRQVALACALPLFLFLLAQLTYNWYLTRFLLIPAALTAPLAARLFTSRAVTGAYLLVGALVATLVVTKDPLRPLNGPFGHPWQMTQIQAIEISDEPAAGRALTAYRRLVPSRACVGTVLDPNEPAFILSGPRLEHRVYYFAVDHALESAYQADLSYVVITEGVNRWAARKFADAGWRLRTLGGYWQLAVAPHPGACA